MSFHRCVGEPKSNVTLALGNNELVTFPKTLRFPTLAFLLTVRLSDTDALPVTAMLPEVLSTPILEIPETVSLPAVVMLAADSLPDAVILLTTYKQKTIFSINNSWNLKNGLMKYPILNLD